MAINKYTEEQLMAREVKASDVQQTRTVTIHMDSVHQSAMRYKTDLTEWYRAIGYLSSWNMTFAHCDIYPDGATDMVAVYSTNGEREYAIGAVWHDDHYGFHS
jgi:hypothetical protein